MQNKTLPQITCEINTVFFLPLPTYKSLFRAVLVGREQGYTEHPMFAHRVTQCSDRPGDNGLSQPPVWGLLCPADQHTELGYQEWKQGIKTCPLLEQENNLVLQPIWKTAIVAPSTQPALGAAPHNLRVAQGALIPPWINSKFFLSLWRLVNSTVQK